MSKFLKWIIFLVVLIFSLTFFTILYEEYRFYPPHLTTIYLFIIIAALILTFPSWENKFFSRLQAAWQRISAKILIVGFFVFVLSLDALKPPSDAAMKAANAQACAEYQEARKICAPSTDYSSCMEKLAPSICATEKFKDSLSELEKAQQEFAR